MRSLGLSIFQVGIVCPTATTNFQLLSIFHNRIQQNYRNSMPIAAISTIYIPTTTATIENGNNGVEEQQQQQQRIRENAAVINNEMDLYKKPDYHSICDALVALVSVPTLILLALMFDSFSQERNDSENSTSINYITLVIGAAFISVGILTCIYVTHRMNVTTWQSPPNQSFGGSRRNSWTSAAACTNITLNNANAIQLPPPSYASVVDSEVPPPSYESIIVISSNSNDFDKMEKKCAGNGSDERITTGCMIHI